MVEPAVRVEERATDSKIEDLLVVAIDIVEKTSISENTTRSPASSKSLGMRVLASNDARWVV